MSSPIVYDKAKYHHETVTEWGLDSVQTEVHTAFFLGWLLDNDLPSEYHVRYSWENYEVLRKRIDQRFRDWQGRP
jgi:hypothetical protein